MNRPQFHIYILGIAFVVGEDMFRLVAEKLLLINARQRYVTSRIYVTEHYHRARGLYTMLLSQSICLYSLCFIFWLRA
jgi:hypothetical protein